jgi:hypothetical protein
VDGKDMFSTSDNSIIISIAIVVLLFWRIHGGGNGEWGEGKLVESGSGEICVLRSTVRSHESQTIDLIALGITIRRNKAQAIRHRGVIWMHHD